MEGLSRYKGSCHLSPVPLDDHRNLGTGWDDGIVRG